MTEREGPLERVRWPTQLVARVVSPGSPARLHGYDVEADLARHYRVSDTLYLSLVGELPDEPRSRAFEVAVQFLAPVPISAAPAHAAALARLCRSRTSGVLATAATGLAEQARWAVEQHRGLLDALRQEGDVPSDFRSESSDDAEAVDRLRALLPGEACPPTLDQSPTRQAALLALLFAVGLEHPWQLEAALVCARLPVVVAEAMAVAPGDFRSYPMDLPAYRYEEDE